MREDPGWRAALPLLWTHFLPWRLHRLKETPALLVLRAQWFTSASLPLTLLLLLSMPEPEVEPARPWFVWIVLGFGVESLAWNAFLARRTPHRLKSRGPTTLDMVITIQWASSFSPPLVGFLSFFLSGNGVRDYFIGLAFAALTLRLFAPTAAALRRWDERLRLPAGSALAILLEPMPLGGKPGVGVPGKDPPKGTRLPLRGRARRGASGALYSQSAPARLNPRPRTAVVRSSPEARALKVRSHAAPSL